VSDENLREAIGRAHVLPDFLTMWQGTFSRQALALSEIFTEEERPLFQTTEKKGKG
jgi:hypothetical protein